METLLILFILILFLIIYSEKHIELFYNSFESPEEIAYYVTSCNKTICVQHCWDEDKNKCIVCLQNKTNPNCQTNSKKTCDSCPYCIWDYQKNKCITLPLAVIPDEYDKEPYKSVS